MKTLRLPKPFEHKHPPVQNANDLFEAQLTFDQRSADWMTKLAGSWRFIITQSILLIAWAILNIVAGFRHWDPYPFILMNLVLSLQAAYSAPIIMMSQNRQATRDRLEAHNDYQINQKAEEEVRAILDHLAAQDQALLQIREVLQFLQEKAANEG